VTEPNRREKDLASCYSSSRDDEHMLSIVLANYREELLRPFIELQRDAEAYRDARAAQLLADLIATARGAP